MLDIKSKLKKSGYAYGGSNIWSPLYDRRILGYRPYGNGLFDIAKALIGKSGVAQKVLNSATTKKLLNSSTIKKVLDSSTVKNLKKAANSTIGKELQKSVLSGVSQATQNAAEGAFQKLGLTPGKKRRKRRTPTKSKKRKIGSGIVLD